MTATSSASLRLGGSMPSQLPLDHPRPLRPTFAGGTIPLAIDRTTVEGLRRAAQAAGGSLFHALVAAHAWWLHLYADSNDVVFGSAHELRDGAELPAVAGNRVTPVVLRCGVSGEEPFAALVGQAVGWSPRRSTIGAVRRAGGRAWCPPDPRNSKLFRTTLLFQSPLTAPADEWSKFDISIELVERPDGRVEGGFVFSADVFDREMAREMASLWCRLLDAIAAEPAIPLADHDLVTPAERHRQLSWNRTTDEGSRRNACTRSLARRSNVPLMPSRCRSGRPH